MKANDTRSADVDQLTILSKQTSIRGGVFEVAHDITVRGTLEGEVTVGGRIDVLHGAEVQGSVHAKEAVIAGRVRGDLFVEGMLTLRASSVVDGTVQARSIAVEDGASGGLVVAAGPDALAGTRVEDRRGHARRELGEALARARRAVAAARGSRLDPVEQNQIFRGADPAPQEHFNRSTDELLTSDEMTRFFRQSTGVDSSESAADLFAPRRERKEV